MQKEFMPSERTLTRLISVGIAIALLIGVISVVNLIADRNFLASFVLVLFMAIYVLKVGVDVFRSRVSRVYFLIFLLTPCLIANVLLIVSLLI